MKWTRWYFPDEISSFQARIIRAMLICSPIFLQRLQPLICYLLWLQFSPVPALVLFIISMVSWGFLLTKKTTNRFQVPCTPSTANPVLVRHYSFMPWADIDFCFVPLHKILHRPTLWSVLNPFMLVPKSETPQFFYKFNVKDATKYANFTV